MAQAGLASTVYRRTVFGDAHTFQRMFAVNVAAFGLFYFFGFHINGLPGAAMQGLHPGIDNRGCHLHHH